MGWTGSEDPFAHLSFATKEQAVALAERQGWDYMVIEPYAADTVGRAAHMNLVRDGGATFPPNMVVVGGQAKEEP